MTNTPIMPNQANTESTESSEFQLLRAYVQHLENISDYLDWWEGRTTYTPEAEDNTSAPSPPPSPTFTVLAGPASTAPSDHASLDFDPPAPDPWDSEDEDVDQNPGPPHPGQFEVPPHLKTDDLLDVSLRMSALYMVVGARAWSWNRFLGVIMDLGWDVQDPPLRRSWIRKMRGRTVCECEVDDTEYYLYEGKCAGCFYAPRYVVEIPAPPFLVPPR